MATAPVASHPAGRWVTRPASTADPRPSSRHHLLGLGLAGLGMVLVVVALLGNTNAAETLGGAEVATTLAWSFAASVLGFGLAKLGIAVILVGIILRLWHRANAMLTTLPKLREAAGSDWAAQGNSDLTGHGPTHTTDHAPAPLAIHRMAATVWLPVLVMGAMALVIGLIVGLATAGAAPGSESFRQLSAWTQGTMFLGEGLLLSGISFLLGTILASLRHAGGEVQEALGLPVQTLRMPPVAKAFIALMAIGMMMAIAQFVLYGVAATWAGDPSTFAAWTTWLGPFRETALGVLLAGIVLALLAISKVLTFQFGRLGQILTTS